MLALTVKQPFAHCIASQSKLVENRSWAAPRHVIGERIAIHAGKSLDAEGYAAVREMELRHPLPEADLLVRGAVVAVARLDGVTGDRSKIPRDQRRWWAGPFGWLLSDVEALVDPVPCRGRQRLWVLTTEVSVRVEAQLGAAA